MSREIVTSENRDEYISKKLGRSPQSKVNLAMGDI